MLFEFATATRIIFGEGAARGLPDLARSFGMRPLVITGSSPQRTAELVSPLTGECFSIVGEPKEGHERVDERFGLKSTVEAFDPPEEKIGRSRRLRHGATSMFARLLKL